MTRERRKVFYAVNVHRTQRKVPLKLADADAVTSPAKMPNAWRIRELAYRAVAFRWECGPEGRILGSF